MDQVESHTPNYSLTYSGKNNRVTIFIVISFVSIISTRYLLNTKGTQVLKKNYIQSTPWKENPKQMA